MSQNALSRKVNGNGKVILDTHPESDQHQNWTCSRDSPPAPTHQIWWWSMNPFLRYLADKNSVHRQTHRQTDRHTPMTTRPCGLRRAGNNPAVSLGRLMFDSSCCDLCFLCFSFSYCVYFVICVYFNFELVFYFYCIQMALFCCPAFWSQKCT